MTHDAKGTNLLLLLQTKRGGGDNTSREAEGAEQLLLANKAFTDDMSLITQLVSNDECA